MEIHQMKGKEKSMTEIRNIIQRLRQHQSKRQIHRELSVHRSIIREISELAIFHGWLDPNLPFPSDEEIDKVWNKNKDIKPHSLDFYKNEIRQWHEQGYSSVVIHRLLQDKCSCDIQVVRRYRNKHFPVSIEPIMVRSTVAGRDLEVDFGELGRFYDSENITRRVWLFSLRLRHSRKAYREVVTDQKLSTFLMGHIRAFEYFNGVPHNCILDNLKAGVIKSTIDNDQVNRSYQAMAEHYGFIICPCLPRTPEHKGGVEGDVKYVKRNFLPYFLEKQKEVGNITVTIRDLAKALDRWTKEIDDTHIVQRVGRSPQELFEFEEKTALKSLPKCRWELTSWSQCTVRRDWRIMYDSAYYSVPYRLIGKSVEICSTSTFIRIYHENREVALHERATKKWEYKRKTEHAPPAQEAVLCCSREGLIAMAEENGFFTLELVKGILSHPSVDKLKPVRHLLRLAEKYTKERLEKACKRAFESKLFSYSSVKNILLNKLDLESLPVEEKKLIHLESYRFLRKSEDYKSEEFSRKETFEEKINRLCPYSKYGNAMMKPFEALIADQVMEEEQQKKEV